tara:strand:+ start:66 stop:488 length:423 start_codon:yes stop_codon:yes gene_type:complete
MNIAAIAAGIGGKKIKGLVERVGALASRMNQDKTKPGHVHGGGSSSSSNSSTDQQRTDALASRRSSEPINVGSLMGFMGKNQDQTFGSLTNPKAELDRGGRTVARPEGVDPVGIEPAMNPPMAVPTPPNIDDEGVNSLYS